MHRVLIVFSRKPDVMEYRRSERWIMSKTNEARRNKRPSPFLASGKGSCRCCCPARKMEGEFSRARPLVRPSHSSPLLPFPPCSLAAALVSVLLSLACTRKGGKGRRRVVKCGEKLREGTTTTTTTDMAGVVASGGEADQYFCTQAPSGSGPWHRGTLAPLSYFRSSLTLISDIVRTYIFT